MLKQVLVPLDGSILAEKALSYAAAVVGRVGHLTLITVIPPTESIIPVVMSDDVLHRLDDARAYLRSMTAYLRVYPQLQVQNEVVVNYHVAEAIIAEAGKRHAEAIVMSTHGRSGISRFIFGSITYKVLSIATCPVFVIPGVETVSGDEPVRNLTPAPTH